MNLLNKGVPINGPYRTPLSANIIIDNAKNREEIQNKIKEYNDEMLNYVCSLTYTGSFRGISFHTGLSLKFNKETMQNEIVMDPYLILRDIAVHLNLDRNTFIQVLYVDMFSDKDKEIIEKKINELYNIKLERKLEKKFPLLYEISHGRCSILLHYICSNTIFYNK